MRLSGEIFKIMVLRSYYRRDTHEEGVLSANFLRLFLPLLKHPLHQISEGGINGGIHACRPFPFYLYTLYCMDEILEFSKILTQHKKSF